MTKPKPFTLRPETIRPLAQAGYSDHDIARTLGVYAQSVQRARRRYKIAPGCSPGRRNTLNPETVELMLAWRKEGLSHAEIGKKLGVNRKTIFSRLRKADRGQIERIDTLGRLINNHTVAPPNLHAIWEEAFTRAIGSLRYEDVSVRPATRFIPRPAPLLSGGSSMGWAAE